MGLYNVERAVWLNLTNGYFSISAQEGSKSPQETFNVFDAFLVKLGEHSAKKGSADIFFRDYYFQDGSIRYKLSLLKNSSLDQSLLNAIAGIEGEIGRITMKSTAKKKDDQIYTNIWVYNNLEEARWKFPYAELPELKKVVVGTKTYTDSSDRDAFFDEIAKGVEARLHAQYGDGMIVMLDKGNMPKALPPGSPVPPSDYDPYEEVYPSDAPADNLPPSDESIVAVAETPATPESKLHPDPIRLGKNRLTVDLLRNGKWDGTRKGKPEQPIIEILSKDQKKVLSVLIDHPDDLNTLRAYEMIHLKPATEEAVDDLPF